MVIRRRYIRKRSFPQVPVELRFIDLFMMAIGTLIFMSILFLVLVRPNTPTYSLINPINNLSLSTIDLPVGFVGQDYNISLSYRGTASARKWIMDDIDPLNHPQGLVYNTYTGTITGIPEKKVITQ